MICNDGIQIRDETALELLGITRGQIDDPARLLECYYWTGEPGVAEGVRALVAMPRESRMALLAFLAGAVVRSAIKATVNEEGSLILHSPEAATLLKTLFGSTAPHAPIVYGS